MTRWTTLGAALALATTVSTAEAQRWTADLRPVLALPSETFGGADLGIGLGFGGTLAYRVMEHLSLYGGWDWIHFASDNSFAGPDMDFEETGYTYGLRFQHPLGFGGLSYRLEAGGTYKHIEIENTTGDIISDSGHRSGFDFGAGFYIPVTNSLSLAPIARYRSLSHQFDIASVTTPAALRYAALELNLSFRF